MLGDSEDFCGNGSHFESLSTSDFAGDGTRLQSFSYGEALEEEREFSILVPVADEVEAYSQNGESSAADGNSVRCNELSTNRRPLEGTAT